MQSLKVFGLFSCDIIIIIGLFLLLAEGMNMNILLVANVLYLCTVVARVHRVQGRDDQLVVPG